MTWYLIFVALRLVFSVFVVMTAAYSLLNYTPFVFYQFLRPRIFGWVNEFVAWHHVLYCGAYVLSVITLVPDLKRPAPSDRAGAAKWRLSVAYVVVFGLVGEWLVVTPYLPKLWNDGRSLAAALLSFVPLVWLAAIDHLAALNQLAIPFSGSSAPERPGATDHRRLLLACVATAEYLWMVHFARALTLSPAGTPVAEWVVLAVWTQTLNLVAATTVYAVLGANVSLSASTSAPRAWEYALTVVLAAAAVATLLLAVVFPMLAFGEHAPVAVALSAGAAVALTWSSLAVRHPRARLEAASSGIDLFIAPLVPVKASWACALLLALLPVATFRALDVAQRTDWSFLLQKTIVMGEWALAFGVVLGATRVARAVRWPPLRTAAAPVLAILLLSAVARTSAYVPAWTGRPEMEADMSLDRYAAVDLSFRLLYDAFVAHPGRDSSFARYVQANTNVSHQASLAPPDVRFAPALTPAPDWRPHIFLFVLDSMRRDYLSPFNPAVTFTPEIARFASESFTFQNAFSRYGGTALSVPSIWAGGLVIHRTSMPEFPRYDALERLLDADGYQWFMSLDTHIGPLLEAHPDLVELDRGRTVMHFDLCRTLGELQDNLDGRIGERPVFAFSLGQNLHISVRQHAPVPPGEHYPGFFEPYAAEVHRIDECFGRFVSYLKRQRLFDDSIVILTTDHGDSLGESGNWGHGVTVYPEVVRIPLIIHVPERLKPYLTTDLARVAFSTDIVPTLYALLGHSTQNVGPLFGATLFVPSDAELTDRRRAGFLLASSYGPTYGMLRANGRVLYIADLVNGREYAYELGSGLLGTRIPVTDGLRRVSQRLIREQIGGIAALYGFRPRP